MEKQVSKKIKILFCTDSCGLTTGLANTARNIFLPLTQMYPNEYEIHQLGFFHFSPKVQVPWPIYQTKVTQTPQGMQMDGNDKYGEQSFHDLVNKIKPDIVFGYGDMWHFNHLIQSPYRNSYRLVTYYTIDGQPYFGGRLEQDGSTEWGSNLSKVDQIVVLSHFGRDVLKASCKEVEDKDIKVMYHAMDMSKFRYLSDEDRKSCRDKLLPKIVDRNAFIAGFIGRNQFRKQNHKLWEVCHYMVHGDYIKCKDCGRVTIKEWNHSARRTKDPDTYPTLLEELTLYDKDYRYAHCWYCKSTSIENGTPDPNFYLFLHIPKKDPGYNHALHERIWKVENNCLYTDNQDNAIGVSEQQLIEIMGTFDCMLHPSGGEGFNNPLFEAMALGIPAVYSDYASHAEFARFGGLPIRVGQYVPELMIGINRSVIDTGSAIEQLIKLRDPTLKKNLGIRGHMHIAQYNLHSMTKAWNNIFQDVYSRPLPLESNKIYATTI